MKKFLFSLCISLISLSAWAATPKVVVSIKPFHDLTVALMSGAGTPTLLFPASMSPHHAELKPSQVQSMREADLVVWVGPELETSLQKPIGLLPDTNQVIKLLSVPNMKTYPSQTHEGTDPHIWLDIENAFTALAAIKNKLIEIDPQHGNLYQRNFLAIKERLLTGDRYIIKQMQAMGSSPAMVFHDAYQYFARRYRVNIVGMIALQPDTPPSAARILEIQQTLKDKNVKCIFSEPQYKPAVVERIVEKTGVGYGELDPMGTGLPSGQKGYEDLMQNMADSFYKCLHKK